ncbi:molybdenum-binding protein [Aliarcobacter cryaerophilus ATCC 43158]|uniref:Transcriptional regulator, ModE family n=1 Tax=Aliarcobacter cryaerophilus ATCC 43158 TaxID=1032070 RepID=A0AAD0TRY7_9BACT|nr:TOBE domain-containing protein [Aliarcobacter cryaerophilus]AYJ79191.1 transcriptional regulator, ModE family [Aliarcobacter cryaerophilus ATCC 43158]PRM94697.1 molybdenum-binding protein [Aliarcobacter cryaerophilus]QCZ23456.1 molybdenum-binding protein [Aliarcobacter cryaerophilus ATCC 43158]
MAISSNLTLELLNQPFLLEKRIELLKAIKQTGSINKAATLVPMSYKSAWEAVEAMNNLSISPIVTKETGGAGGGGTKLTNYGENLLTTYSLLKEEQRKFLENLNRITDLNSGTLKTIRRLSMQISARNQIIGTIEKISLGAVNAEIQMKLKSGKSIISIITNSSVENLGLAINDEVVAVIKSSNVLLSTETNLKLSARNSLNGNIEEINIGSVNAEIVVNIGNEDKIVAIVNINSIENMNLKIGANVDAVIKASDIMIGK